MKTKKILVLLMALTMVLAMIPAFADTTTTWTYVPEGKNHDASHEMSQWSGEWTKIVLAYEDGTTETVKLGEATCTEEGHAVTVEVCRDCGGMFSNNAVPTIPTKYTLTTTPVNKDAHSFGTDLVKLPADQQTEEGYTLYGKECADCGAFAEITKVKNETEKVWTRDYLIECIEEAKCPWCGKEATFNYSMAEVSCEQDFSMTVNCSDANCLSKHSASKIEFKKGEHIWEEIQVDTDSTSCAVQGNITYKVLCAICGDINRTWEESTAVKDHILWDDAMAEYDLTVDADGYLSASNDAAKNAVDWFNLNKTNALKEHDANWKGGKYNYDAKNLSVALTPATCTEDGSIVVTCDVNGCKQGVTIKIAKLGHDYDMANALVIAATCETDGVKVAFCTRCDELDTTVVQAAYEHSYDNKRVAYIQNGKIHEEMALGVIPDGIVECQPYDKVLLCDCYGMVTVIVSGEDPNGGIKLSGHLEALKEALKEYSSDLDLTEALSIEAGNLVYVCQGKMNVDLGITSWTHDHKDFLTNKGTISEVLYENTATCTDAYELMVKCKDCDYVAKYVGEALGHDWANDGEVIKAATCTEKGETKVSCRRPGCRATTTITTPAAGHLTQVHYDPKPGCTTPGVKVEYCTRCEKEVSRTTVPAAHTIGNVTKIENAVCVYTGNVITGFENSNCTLAGYAEYICSVCDQKQTWSKEAQGHVFNFDNIIDNSKDDGNLNGDWHSKVIEVVPATCSNDGYVTVECEKCDAQSTKTTEKAYGHFAAGHTETVKTIIAPSCVKTGLGIVKCKDCGRQEERELATVDHTLKLEGNLLVCSVNGCDYTEKLDFDVQYKVSMENAVIEATKTSGVGHITLVKGKMDAPLYARINFGYTLENGDPVAYVANVEIDEHGDFRMASPTCPHGATLTNIFVTITTAPGAQDMVINDVPNLGFLTIR